MFGALLALVALIARSAIAFFRSREHEALVELALRQQLSVYVHRHLRPRLSPLDRAFWVALSRFWPGWRSPLWWFGQRRSSAGPHGVPRLLAMDLKTRT